MNILLAAATKKEVENIMLQQRDDTFHCGQHSVKILITGVGMPITLFQLTHYCDLHKVDMILQAGIAGSFQTETPLGMTYAIENEYFGDLGVEENTHFFDLFDKNFLEPDQKPFTNKALRNPSVHDLNKIQLPIVNAITVNEISTRPERISQLKEKYQPTLESMEGAALHLTALQLNIAFLQIRAVSNYVGERDKSKWNIPSAIENLNNKTLALINAL